MKHSFYLFLVLLLLASCKNEGGSGVSGAPSGSAAPAQLPPQDMAETTVLTSRFWVFEHWVDLENPADKANKGRWYRFYPDGTYDGGHWEDHYDHGTWFIRKGAEFVNLFIDSEVNDNMDGKWEIQGISNAADAMSWVKTGEYGDKSSAMCKTMAMLSIPTKAQFGLE